MAVTLYSLFDCSARDSTNIRIMPKWAWLLVILFIPVIGLLMWFIFGRGWQGQGGPGAGGSRRRGPVAPDDDPDYLRRISEDLDQQRRRESHEDSESHDQQWPGRAKDGKDRRHGKDSGADQQRGQDRSREQDQGADRDHRDQDS